MVIEIEQSADVLCIDPCHVEDPDSPILPIGRLNMVQGTEPYEHEVNLTGQKGR